MPRFTGVEIWTDVQCASGTRRAFFARSDLVAAQETFSVFNPERAVFGVRRDDERVTEIVRGRVARFCTTDATDYTEWRIADLEDGGTGRPAVLVISCDAIAADLSRALYRTASAIGAPSYTYTIDGQTPTAILTSGVVRTALDTASLTWLVVGTVNPTNVVSFTGEYGTARQILTTLSGSAYAPGETRVRRNGSTDYKIDLIDRIGSATATLRLRTGRNLLALDRRRFGADAYTRVTVRGPNDGTHRGIRYAFWEVTAVNTAGQDYIELTDPRGGTYPGPARFADQFNGFYAAEIGVAYTDEAITDTIVVSATTTRLEMADASTFTVGDFVEFRTAAGAAAAGLDRLDNIPAQTTYGIHERLLDVDGGSGAVSYVPNGDMSTWTTDTSPPDGWTKVLTQPTTRNAVTTRFGGYSYKIADGTGAGTGCRTPAIKVFDDAGYSWRLWVWVYIENDNSVLVRVLRADTFALIGALTETLNGGGGDYGHWFLVDFETTDVGAAGGGCVIEVKSNGVTTFYVDAAGCQPSTWTRRDVYGPLGDDPCANDLWHTGNDNLELAEAPSVFECSVLDLEALDGTEFSDDVIELGDTIEATDTRLDLTDEQRILQFTRYHLGTRPTQLVLGTTRQALGQILAAQKTPPSSGDTTRAVAQALISVAAAVAAGSSTEITETGAPTSTEGTLQMIGGGLLSAVNEGLI
jgi:hypothetical protein